MRDSDYDKNINKIYKFKACIKYDKSRMVLFSF